MARTLAVICDVGPALGVGHVMRCLALAEEFASRGFAVEFLADVHTVPFVQDAVAARGFGARPLPDGVPATMAALRALAPEVVVVDSYYLPRELYAALRTEFRTVAVVDGDPGGRAADVYVDHNVGAELDSWTLAPDSVRLAGLDYAMLRSDVLERRPTRPKRGPADPAARVFAVFGGTDAFGAGPVLAQALVETGEPFALTVVAPQPWPVPETGPGQRIELIGPTDRLADHVLAADLVISAAGSSSWELLCLGAACALVAVVENQAMSYERIVAAGAVAGLGWLDDVRRDPSAASTTLARLLRDDAERDRLRAAGWRLIDGRGRVRVADAVASDRLSQ